MTARHTKPLRDVNLRSSRLGRRNEASADPDGLGTKSKGHSKATAVKDTTSGDDTDRLARHGRHLALAQVDDLGDEDARGHVT